jgi:SHS2 domain-containing protein
MYELFEHTADMGLRVRARDLETLFREAAEGLFSIIAGEQPRSEGSREHAFELQAGSRDDLFFDWLNELLYTSHTERELLRDFEVNIDGMRLEATARGSPLDLAVSDNLREVKAITYHGLKVEPTTDGWLAEVVVDI